MYRVIFGQLVTAFIFIDDRFGYDLPGDIDSFTFGTLFGIFIHHAFETVATFLKEPAKVKNNFESEKVWKSHNRGFSMGVVQPKGEVIYLTGQVAWDSNENIIGTGDVAEQTRQCFRNIEFLLLEVGATLSDIVSITTYFLNLEDLPRIQEVRNEFLSSKVQPVSTSVKVAGLGHEDFLVELTPIAVLPKK